MTNQKRFGTLSKGVSRAALSVALGMCFATGAMAQAQTGALRITVTGNGGPVAGATVIVSSPDSLVTKTGVTDAEGRVRVSGLDPATNYTVEVESAGYTEFTADNVAVVTGRDLSLGYSLSTAGSADATNLGDIVVTGRSLAAVDVTSATIGTTLTLDTVESLPTGRSYQSYLQLVPGVKPGSNPSSKSGINSSVTGVTSSSSDNIYILDGVNVTDPVTGTFGANINSEIIQEQQVITGGVPAEYEGGSGLISRVVTKSGSNEWHGSLNYYLQNDDLVEKDEHLTSAGFSTYDAAVTLGGPILRDRLWFFGSYQKTYREDEVVNPTTGILQRTVEREGEYAFGKLTWQITENDRLSATYFNDPLEISGTSTPTTRNYRDTSQNQGGDNYKVEYSRTMGDLSFNAYYFKHEAELTTLAADQSVRNNVIFRTGAVRTYEEENIGGAGANTERFRNKDEWGVNFEYYLDTRWGSHTFKAGYTMTENESIVEGLVPGDVTYTSVSTRYPGATFGQIANSEFTLSPVTIDDSPRVIAGINASANRAALYAIVDTNNNGVLSDAEINAIAFNNTAGNPGGQINALRTLRTQNGVNNVGSKGQSFFIQDSWTLNQLTINAGVRAEEWEHTASTGESLFTFDWELAPRVSVVYDLFGDGRSKVWAFGGRYYDPIRNDMTSFAGSLSGAVNEEQINIGGNWVTYRTRGGAVVLDSIFAPSMKTPYTDEFVLGFSKTLGQNYSLSVIGTQRNTRDISEDYDLAIYSDPNGDVTAGRANSSSSLYLPYSYFGLSADQIADVQAGNINYVLGTLAGGKRDYKGLEVTLQKFRSDNWQGLVSYTFNDAKGNTQSDGNAGVQGDFIFLDPRGPNAYGQLPGNIRHMFKAYGSYEFDFGLELAAVFQWNSGLVYTPIQSFSGYAVGPRETVANQYYYEGIRSTWLRPGFAGAGTMPSYYTLDVRASYDVKVPFGEVELFLDVFNVLNKQSATSEYTNVVNSVDYDFGEANAWVAPRRAYLGVRYSF